MNKKHQNLLQELAPRPLPSKKEYDKEQKALDPNKPRYFVRDKYGVERLLSQNFNPKNEEQIKYIVRARNVTIIRKTETETKEFTPQSQINIQAAIINSFEILHSQHEWINVEMIRKHLATLQIDKTEDEILNELRTIYKKAQSNANSVECNYRESTDKVNEFQIKSHKSNL